MQAKMCLNPPYILHMSSIYPPYILHISSIFSGYIVHSSVRRSGGVQALRFIVQSDRHPVVLEQRILAFVDSVEVGDMMELGVIFAHLVNVVFSRVFLS